MATKNEIVVREQQAMEKPADLLSIIQKVVDGPLDLQKVEVLERLLAMQERVEARQRETAFVEALARLQPKLPQIDKHGAIVVKGQLRSKYAKYEDIDVIIRPLLAEEGFSFSFDADSSDAKIFKLSCKLSHRYGHSEVKTITLPLDKSDYRSDVQSIGSTISYGKRQLVKMHLNLVERDEDKDGVVLQFLSDEQAKDLDALISEVKADKAGFLKWMGVKELTEIPVGELRRAIEGLEAKRHGK